MVEVMRRDFNEHHMTQVSITRIHFGTMQMMEEVSDLVGMNYLKTPDSRYLAQPVDAFLFTWEEGSVNNLNTFEEDEGFSEPKTPVRKPPRKPPALEARPALRSIETLRNSSAARQLFNL